MWHPYLKIITKYNLQFILWKWNFAHCRGTWLQFPFGDASFLEFKFFLLLPIFFSYDLIGSAHMHLRYAIKSCIRNTFLMCTDLFCMYCILFHLISACLVHCSSLEYRKIHLLSNWHFAERSSSLEWLKEGLLFLIWLEITNFAALFHSFNRQGTWRKVTERKSHF